jgi:hypothetical protein
MAATAAAAKQNLKNDSVRMRHPSDARRWSLVLRATNNSHFGKQRANRIVKAVNLPQVVQPGMPLIDSFPSKRRHFRGPDFAEI